MTKPIESMYRSDSSEKLKRAEVKRKTKLADVKAVGKINTQFSKDKNNNHSLRKTEPSK